MKDWVQKTNSLYYRDSAFPSVECDTEQTATVIADLLNEKEESEVKYKELLNDFNHLKNLLPKCNGKWDRGPYKNRTHLPCGNFAQYLLEETPYYYCYKCVNSTDKTKLKKVPHYEWTMKK